MLGKMGKLIDLHRGHSGTVREFIESGSNPREEDAYA